MCLAENHWFSWEKDKKKRFSLILLFCGLSISYYPLRLDSHIRSLLYFLFCLHRMLILSEQSLYTESTIAILKQQFIVVSAVGLLKQSCAHAVFSKVQVILPVLSPFNWTVCSFLQFLTNIISFNYCNNLENLTFSFFLQKRKKRIINDFSLRLHS